MIPVNQLRFGNWIKFKDDFGFEESQIVAAITPDIAKWLDPIPLTEDWLLKFGFDGNKIPLNSTTTLYVNTNESEFIVHIADEGQGGVRVKDIHYVHELQNLFYVLVGEELTVKETV